MSCIDVNKVVKIYDKSKIDGARVLNEFNLKLNSGTIFTLIGASGCGKTTFFTCLLGMQKIQNGEIRVFGQKVSHKKTLAVSHLVGYMPQQTALVPQLTIRETFQYFGDIFMMTSKYIEERINVVSKLLDLPNLNKQIQELSGGEKRRVSMAVAIFHNPKLLLLDEPTVGLDFELRANIWDFLRKSVENGVSVLITTHYIGEALHADRCGFMRNGRLIADDTPERILMSTNCETLDGAFYMLCTKTFDGNYRFFREKQEVRDENEEKLYEIQEKRGKFRLQVFKALILKEIHRIRRQPIELITLFVLPILLLVLYFNIIGSMPKDLKVGIVSNETISNGNFLGNISNCDNENALLWIFIYEINAVFGSEYFHDFHEAFEKFKSGKLNGVVVIPDNLTEMMINVDFERKNIDVYIDYKDYITTFYLKANIFKIFKISVEKFQENCKFDLKMIFMKLEAMFGDIDVEFNKSVGGIASVLISYGLGLVVSVLAINSERAEGTWNRTFLSGVKISEIMLKHAFLSATFATLVAIQSYVALIIYIGFEIPPNSWILIVILWLSLNYGFIHGFFMSIIFDSVFVLSGIGGFIAYANVMFSGMFWPLEAIHPVLMPIIYIAPTVYPITSFLDVMMKGYGIGDSSVYFGIFFMILWIIILAMISKYMIKMFKYSREIM